MPFCFRCKGFGHNLRGCDRTGHGSTPWKTTFPRQLDRCRSASVARHRGRWLTTSANETPSQFYLIFIALNCFNFNFLLLPFALVICEWMFSKTIFWRSFYSFSCVLKSEKAFLFRFPSSWILSPLLQLTTYIYRPFFRRRNHTMAQQQKQRLAEEEQQEAAEIQHGPFPIEQLQVFVTETESFFLTVNPTL